MTSYLRGSAALLTVEFFEYAGGPRADVTGLTITVVPVAGGDAVVGPTSVGVAHAGTGLYSYSWAIPLDATVTDYLVTWTANEGTAAETIAVATNVATPPTADEAIEYLGGDVSWSEEEIQSALDAETAAQRAVCRIGETYPADLREALLRRVQRNLAMRGLPLAVLQGDAEVGSTLLPGRDPEVRRLEAPHRKLVVG